VLAKIAENRVLICGTNAYKPLCRHYHFKVSFLHYQMRGRSYSKLLFDLGAETVPSYCRLPSVRCIRGKVYVSQSENLPRS
jgi:hypothetical protein